MEICYRFATTAQGGTGRQRGYQICTQGVVRGSNPLASTNSLVDESRSPSTRLRPVYNAVAEREKCGATLLGVAANTRGVGVKLAKSGRAQRWPPVYIADVDVVYKSRGVPWQRRQCGTTRTACGLGLRRS